MTPPNTRREANTSDTLASLSVVEAVAAAEDVEPVTLEPPLFRVIDPTALDRLFADGHDGRARPSGTVEFEYHGYDVSVRADGTVSLA